VVSGIAVLVLLLAQDPFQNQIDEALRQFQDAAELDQALTVLSSQLSALGAQATNPIARRLAEDLRDGMTSAAAPAFIDALVGRPDALAPLQSAFRDAATSVSGRIELAAALLQLDDAMSWRAGLLAIASDDKSSLLDRLHASRVLLEAEDAQAPPILRKIVDELPERPEGEQRQVVEFLGAANTPLTRDLLRAIVADERLPSGTRQAAHPAPAFRDGLEEPHQTIVDHPPRRSPGAARATVKKKETADSTFLTMPSILAGGITLVLLILLGIEILRKG
jgi:hypothetical protein